MKTPSLSRLAAIVAVAVLCMGAEDCNRGATKPVAGATGPTNNPVTPAIATSKTAHEAELRAMEKRGAAAAAGVAAIVLANTNQPAGAPTDFIDREARLALTNLPPADPLAALETERRRAAIFAGNLEEARRLYGEANSANAKMAVELADAKAKARKAEDDLERLNRENLARLEANRLENQRVIDAAEKKAAEAVENANRERNSLISRSLIGAGILCVLAGIGLAIATSGASVVRSGIAIAGGAVCFGLAQVISQPWFTYAFAAVLIGLLLAGAGMIWWEWKSARDKRDLKAKLEGVVEEKELVDETLGNVVKVMEESGAAVTNGTVTELGAKLARKLDKSHKAVIKRFRNADE